MTIPSFPYSLDYFQDTLKISEVMWSVQRNDELSGVADGRIWQAELADPLWIGEVTLSVDRINAAKQVSAKIRALQGILQSFYCYDPMSKYPQADSKGLLLPSDGFAVSAVATDRQSMTFGGLPANYVLTIADKMQVSYASNALKFAFLEISGTSQASSSGVITVPCFPAIPIGVDAGSSVTLKKPACLVGIVPNSHDPGKASTVVVDGQTFKVIQRRRSA